MGFFSRLMGREGNDNTVTDFQVATAEAALHASAARNSALEDAAFRMVVDDVFSITGRGTVVTGSVASGAVTVGDRVTITAGRGVIQSEVTGIELFRKSVKTAGAGQAVGLLLSGVSRDDVATGALIATA